MRNIFHNQILPYDIHILHKINLTWRNPPPHHWYAAKSPGLSIQCRSSRAHQTALAPLRSGHLRSMTFVQGVKSFFTCPCSLLASPAHLLDSWGVSLRQLYEEQDLVCETTKRNGEKDLGSAFRLQEDWKQQHQQKFYFVNYFESS
ncbi:uncharacterized protein TNCV_126131 [Trichonephila clavipes]|nr:uncharacterized protein TNCV_126131 [Trichonephila clavipes]